MLVVTHPATRPPLLIIFPLFFVFLVLLCLNNGLDGFANAHYRMVVMAVKGWVKSELDAVFVFGLLLALKSNSSTTRFTFFASSSLIQISASFPQGKICET